MSVNWTKTTARLKQDIWRWCHWLWHVVMGALFIDGCRSNHQRRNLSLNTISCLSSKRRSGGCSKKSRATWCTHICCVCWSLSWCNCKHVHVVCCDGTIKPEEWATLWCRGGGGGQARRLAACVALRSEYADVLCEFITLAPLQSRCQAPARSASLYQWPSPQTTAGEASEQGSRQTEM